MCDNISGRGERHRDQWPAVSLSRPYRHECRPPKKNAGQNAPLTSSRERESAPRSSALFHASARVPETRRTPAVLPAAAVAMETGPPTRLDCHRGGSSGRRSSIPRSRVRRGEALCVACQALLGHCTTVCLWCHGEITLLYNLMRL